MQINDICFDLRLAVRKKCICFARNGNTVIKPYRTLYPMSDFCKTEQDLYLEIVHGREFEDDYYFVWEDLGIVCVKQGYADSPAQIEELLEAFKSYPYFGVTGYLKRLHDLELNGGYIDKVDIEVCVMLGEIDLASHYEEYRNKKILDREEKRKAEIVEFKAREKEEEERHAKEVIKIVTDAEDCIRRKKILHNRSFEGTSLILYLFKRYGVHVPIRTQGWINKALAQIYFHNGQITYSYYSSSKDSTVFYKYLRGLEEKILSSDCDAC